MRRLPEIVERIINKCGITFKGDSYNIDMTNKYYPENTFEESVIPFLRTLRDRKYEHVSLSYSAPRPYDNIKFIQTAKYDDFYRVEIGIDLEDGSYHIYALKKANFNEMVEAFRVVCVFIECPDLSKWTDVTNEVLAVVGSYNN